MVWQFFAGRKSKNLPPRHILLINTLMFISMFIDLISIWTGTREPSNDIRYLTGILFGGALSIYLYPAFISLVLINCKNYTGMNSFSMYSLFLLTSIGAFFIKEIDTIFAFWMFYALSVLGFGSFMVLLLGSIGFLSKSFISKAL